MIYVTDDIHVTSQGSWNHQGLIATAGDANFTGSMSLQPKSQDPSNILTSGLDESYQRSAWLQPEYYF